MKTLWIINEYAGSPYNGMEYRHYYLGKEFTKLGYNVNIISSSYSHLFYKLPKKRKENIDGINYLWIKTLNYGNSHNKKRVLKWFLFTLKIFFLPLSLKKPDVIIVSPMAPFPIFPAWIVSKIYKAKLVYEVKDIWPLSLIELGKFNSRHPLIKLMSLFERFALKRSDVIVSNLQNYGEHIKKDLGLNKDFVWISNGIDLEEIKNTSPLDDKTKNLIPKDKFLIGYVGTIGLANALESFCETAKILKDKKEILFVLVGDGQEKKKLINQYGNLDNILFIDAIPKKQVQSMLTLFDICYIGFKKEKLYEYGVSPNKLFDYMLSGKPILYSINSRKNIVDIAKCGITVDAENPKAIADGILKLYEMPQEELKKMGENGRKYVLQHFTFEKLAKKFMEVF